MAAKKRLKKIAVKHLQIDRNWQREPVTSHVNYLAGDWHDDAAGVLLVSERDDGTFWVMDGQHRMMAKRRTDPNYEFYCWVYMGLTTEEEAYLFALFNDKRKGVAQYDKYRANLLSGNPLHRKVEKVLKSHSLKASRGGGQHEVGAIAKVLSITNKYGAPTLDDTLTVVEEAWGRHDGECWRATVLGSVSFLLGKKDADPDRLVETLRVRVPSAWLSMQNTAGSTSGSAQIVLTYNIVKEYNRTMRGKARITLP